MSPRAPAPWPPPPYETGDPVLGDPVRRDPIHPEPSDWGYPNARSAPDPPPADDPGRITFKTATEAMKNFAAQMGAIGNSMRAAAGSTRELERALAPRLERHVLAGENESDRVYTEAEVSEIDATNEALRNGGEEVPRYWWRRVGDRYRQVMASPHAEGYLVNEHDGQPLRLAEERPIGIALESGAPGDVVAVQVSGTFERLPPDQRPHPGPVVRAARQDEMQAAIVAALRGVARDPRTDIIGNGVTQEQLANCTTAAERYQLLWRAGLIDEAAYRAGPTDYDFLRMTSVDGTTDLQREPPPPPVVPVDPRKRRLRVRKG